ncbi:putative ribonuclease H-like domain-containing protein [Tanacetum coccineum]
MTGNKCYLTKYEDYNHGFVSFGDGKGRISSKGKIKTGTLDFDNVYFCKELKYNLFSLSQICDKKNNVLFTDTECLVLSSNFKLLDESQVLLRVLRKDNIYSVVPTKGLTCLFAKATIDESNLWHRRLGKESNTKPLDETSGILKTFINETENQLDYKVKVIRSDNGTEFKNSVMNQFYEMKGIKREFSIARTPQQNGFAERRNRTLIKAARTMLVDSKLPTTFWAEAVNTACYVLNRVLVIKPHTKTPYELIRGRTPLIDFIKPFGCPVTILNTRDHLGKFDGKDDEGFFVGYSVVSKALRVFNKRIRIVEETLNIRFLENASNVIGNGPDSLFDVDSLTISINYVRVAAGNQTNCITGTRDNIVAGPKDSEEDIGIKPTEVNESGASDKGEEDEQDTRSEFERLLQQEKQTNSTNSFNTIGTPVSTVGSSFTNDDPSSLVNATKASNAFEDYLFKQFSPFKNAFTLPDVPNVSPMDDNTEIFAGAYDDEDVGGHANLNNLETTMNVFRNKKDKRGIVVRNKAKLVAQGYTQEEGIDYDEVFAPVARIEAIRLFLAYASYMGFIVYQMDVKSAFLYGTIEEEVYVCQPPGFEDTHFPDKVYKVEKALYGLHQAPRAWYETLSTYLLENRFRRGTIDKTLFFKKDKSDILLGLQRSLYVLSLKKMMHKRFQMSSIRELTFFLGLQVQQKEDGIFISQDKYVADIMKKFDFVTVKTASIPMEPNKALVKDEEADNVEVHLNWAFGILEIHHLT